MQARISHAGIAYGVSRVHPPHSAVAARHTDTQLCTSFTSYISGGETKIARVSHKQMSVWQLNNYQGLC